MDLRQSALEVSNQKVSLNFHCALVGGQIDVENLNKLTPLNGASLLAKKNKKKCMEHHCVKLFGVVHFCLCIKGNGN